MSEIFYAQVASSLSNGRYFVKRMFTGKPNPYEIAVLLSPLPSGALRTALTDNETHYCWCAKEGVNVCILGFVPPHGTASFNDASTGSDDKGGFEMHTGPTGMLKGYADGSIGMFAEPYSQILLEPRPQSIFMQTRNLIIRLWSGFITYMTSDDKGTFTLFISKFLDKTALPAYKNSQVPDSIKTEIGTLAESSAIVRNTIKQKFDSTGVVGTNIVSIAGGDTVYQLTFTDRDTNSNATLTINLDGSVSYDNQKCKVSIDASGNASIKTADGANIKLGGTGNEQAVVLLAWITQVFNNHIHPTTSPGSPTLPPAPNLNIPVSSDSSSNQYSFTTEIE